MIQISETLLSGVKPYIYFVFCHQFYHCIFNLFCAERSYSANSAKIMVGAFKTRSYAPYCRSRYIKGYCACTGFQCWRIKNYVARITPSSACNSSGKEKNGSGKSKSYKHQNRSGWLHYILKSKKLEAIFCGRIGNLVTLFKFFYKKR